MIITAPYRSGGTSACIAVADQYKLSFAGQIDVNTVPFTRTEDKNLVHEHDNQPDHTVRSIINMLNDHSEVVILNNSNPALLKQTDIFLMRYDMARVYYSMFKLTLKFYPRMPSTMAESLFKRITFFTACMKVYMKDNHIVPSILEEQPWYIPKEYEPIPRHMQDMIDPHITYLQDVVK
jgi:hypothetical protein